MIRSQDLYARPLKDTSSKEIPTWRVIFCKNLLRYLTFAALSPLCLLLCMPLAVAAAKTKRSSVKSSTKTKRVVDNKRSSSKQLASKRSVDKKRNVAEKKQSKERLAGRQDKKRTLQRPGVQLTSRVRERAQRQSKVPAVNKSIIIKPKQPDNVSVSRPTLVNDIVIISEAREVPTASRVSPIMGSGRVDSGMPSIWPVAGAIRGGFGVRHNPFGGRGSEFHKGQDISAPYGSQVIATADGIVVIAGWLRGYGNVVYVDHGNGISTRYGHLSRIDVTVGQVIKRGDYLGLVGSTGRSTGPHLHYEVRIDGQATNPIPYLPNIPAPISISPANR